MLAKLLAKRNTSTLLVGILSSATALENNMEVSQKIKKRITIKSSDTAHGHVSKGMYSRM
jgi:hypothetical protein